ncbi:flagellar basal-body MS-ring/collar protein FliF [Dyella silvatica]|uniref:flagellar basal-body MS-ring/collar protein FliF n=1 Tax=Dyella silvatica TaxID=2992128 RepID=UPI00224D77CC|nr:flagellar basal-body MS-ring/collar protein FliF [Dyella silvatica]
MASARSLWDSWSAGKRLMLGLGVLLIVAVAVALGWWSTRPSYGVLFNDLRQVDAAEIATSLDSLQIPHRFADDGATVLVPADTVYDTRMKLVAQGVPHGGSVGFEVFKDSDFGVTEFAQRVNYQRALQGELERTISSIAEVQSARVHLTLRRATMFETQDAPSKASVTLGLHPGKSLAPKQVVGIQRLIASAVEGLTPESVVVLGDGGAVLSGNGRAMGDEGDEQARIEQRLHQRIDGMLREALGAGTPYTVSVDVQLNYDRVKQVRDKLVPQGKDGNGLVVRQKTSNSHPVANTEDGAHTQGSSGESELEFAHSREQEEIEVAPGRVVRISVGILVPPTVDQATLVKLNTVIADAAGLDVQRGDHLDIATVSGLARSGVEAVKAPVVKATPAAVYAAGSFTPSLAIAAALALAVLGFLIGLGVARLRQPKRLTQAERERLLRDVQHWIDSPERS